LVFKGFFFSCSLEKISAIFPEIPVRTLSALSLIEASII